MSEPIKVWCEKCGWIAVPKDATADNYDFQELIEISDIILNTHYEIHHLGAMRPPDRA